jgi:hypothetical protein
MGKMNTINVLIVVDVEGALSDQQHFGEKYVYLVDTTGYVSGNNGQGTSELTTTCHDTQKIIWNVVSIAPSDDVSIDSFTGQMITDRACIPIRENDGSNYYWQGTVETQGTAASYQYSVVLSFNNGNTKLTFDPFINVVHM